MVPTKSKKFSFFVLLKFFVTLDLGTIDRESSDLLSRSFVVLYLFSLFSAGNHEEGSTRSLFVFGPAGAANNKLPDGRSAHCSSETEPEELPF